MCEQRDKKAPASCRQLGSFVWRLGLEPLFVKSHTAVKKSLKETLFKSSGDRQATDGGMLMLDCTDKNY